MRLIAASKIFRQVAAYMGRTLSEMPSQEWEVLRTFVSMRLGRIWNEALWPDVLRSEQRYFRDHWAAGTTYAAGDQVFYVNDSTYYQSLRGSSLGNRPDDSQAYWYPLASSYEGDDWASGTTYAVGDVVKYLEDGEYYACHTAHTSSATYTPDATGGDARWGQLTVFDRHVDLDQSGQTPIGVVLQVSNESLYRTTRRASVEWTQSNEGIQVLVDATSVWLLFWTLPPELNGDVYDATATYSAGDQVYFTNTAGDGNFYDCLATTTAGQSPSSESSKWDLVQIPYAFHTYCSKGAYADWLVADGQHEKALAAERAAERELSEISTTVFSHSGIRPALQWQP